MDQKVVEYVDRLKSDVETPFLSRIWCDHIVELVSATPEIVESFNLPERLAFLQRRLTSKATDQGSDFGRLCISLRDTTSPEEFLNQLGLPDNSPLNSDVLVDALTDSSQRIPGHVALSMLCHYWVLPDLKQNFTSLDPVLFRLLHALSTDYSLPSDIESALQKYLFADSPRDDDLSIAESEDLNPFSRSPGVPHSFLLGDWSNQKENLRIELESLSCVPHVLKQSAWEYLLSCDDYQRQKYLEYNLKVLKRYVQPNCDSSLMTYWRDFSEICSQLSAATLDQISRRCFGYDVAPDDAPGCWFQAAETCLNTGSLAQGFYLMACGISDPKALSGVQEVDEAVFERLLFPIRKIAVADEARLNRGPYEVNPVWQNPDYCSHRAICPVCWRTGNSGTELRVYYQKDTGDDYQLDRPVWNARIKCMGCTVGTGDVSGLYIVSYGRFTHWSEEMIRKYLKAVGSPFADVLRLKSTWDGGVDHDFRENEYHFGFLDPKCGSGIIPSAFRKTLPGSYEHDHMSVMERAIGDVKRMREWIAGASFGSWNIRSRCRNVVNIFSRACQFETGEFEIRSEFIRGTRELWEGIKWLLFTEAEYHRVLENWDEKWECVDAILSWSEAFQGRLLLEEFRLWESDRPTSESHRSDVRQASWPFKNGWPENKLNAWNEAEVNAWFEEARRGNTNSDGSSELGLRDRPRCTTQDLDAKVSASTPERKASTASQRIGGLSAIAAQSISEFIPGGGIWLRAMFDSDERLHWWAMRNDREVPKVLAHGVSLAGAQSRISSAVTEFDDSTQRIWNYFRWLIEDCGYDAVFEPVLGPLTHAIKQICAGEDPAEFDGQSALDELKEMHFSWPALAKTGMQLMEFLDDRHTTPVAETEALRTHWNSSLDELRKIELDVATHVLLRRLSRDLDLSALWDHRPDPTYWSMQNIQFQVDGPLLEVPLSLLDFGRSHLFERVASTSMVVSSALRRLVLAKVTPQVVPSKRILSAHWEESPNRRAAQGLPLLHAAVCRIAQDYGFELHAAGDEPIFNSDTLQARLRESVGVAVLGAHGASNAPGICLADGIWCGEFADLSEVDLLILCSCAVGRLTQGSGRDVEGLYTRLAAHGARCVVAAKWTIADRESAVFMAEFLNEYFMLLSNNGDVAPFDRATALNRARKRLLKSSSPLMKISHHVATAFEIYGLS